MRVIQCCTVMTMLSSIRMRGESLSVFYPDVCQVCREVPASIADGYVCEACRGRVRFIDSPMCQRCGLPYAGNISGDFTCGNCEGQHLYFERARASVFPSGLMRDVIHQFKYSSATWFEPFVAETFLQQALPDLTGGNWDAVVPTPLHPVKLRERGFNQAECLAVPLAERLRVPLMNDDLSRVKFTCPQATLSRADRFENMRGAFNVNLNSSITGKRLVLVDDVMTTGATVNACAEALKRGGAIEVTVWTLSRGGLSADLA